MKQSIIPSAQAIVSHCEVRGIKDIIISPGSRNAPLTISFTENPFFQCYSIVDERSAGFFALGMAMQQKRPVALVCTSGSALLNYYPAITEACYSRIPLIAISADRPPYKIDVGDGQTIRQENVFKNHIGYSANLRLDVNHAIARIKRYGAELLQQSQNEVQEFNDGELLKALNVACHQRLPVHINAPFEEPLYNTRLKEHGEGITIDKPNPPEKETIALDSARQLWQAAKRKMVLVGVNYPNELDKEVLDALANDPSVIVFTETTSNVHHPNFFPSIDSVLFPIEKSKEADVLFKKLRPELLLTFGGMIVSKKVKAFLRLNKPDYHWHVGNGEANDTFFSLSRHFMVQPQNFLNDLLHTNYDVQSTYYEEWAPVKVAYEKKRSEYLSKIDFSDFMVFGMLQSAIPKNYQVHLANSSTVRYTQLFDMPPSLEVFCNRGTSGIEGSTSTAIGASIYHRAPTLLITGDLSFLYDSNALWNNYTRSDFRVIIVNNSGGGIFRILPGKEATENFKTFFETRHSISGIKIGEQFGFETATATNESELRTALRTFFEASEHPKILEVFTPPELNDQILLDYFDFLS